MKMIQMKYCQFNGCTNKVNKGAYCDDHRRVSPSKKKVKNIYHHKNKSFYQSDPWKDLRSDVYEREKGKCQRCGKFVFGRTAHCHHVIAIKDNPLLKLEINNIMLLCPKCHVIVENEEKPKKVFASYFNSNPPLSK